MDILKDIEKNILNINMNEKGANAKDPLNANNSNVFKLNTIKKRISDYFEYKNDASNIIAQKKMKYQEIYNNVRENNNTSYDFFLEKKEDLRNILKETKTLSALYDYLNYKIIGYKEVPDIYTSEYISLEERVVKPSNAAKAANAANAAANHCPAGKVLNPKTKKCVNAKKVKAKADDKADNDKAGAAKVKKVCPEGKVLNPKTNRCIKDVNYKPK
jgi:DNA repair ATPase RecN